MKKYNYLRWKKLALATLCLIATVLYSMLFLVFEKLGFKENLFLAVFGLSAMFFFIRGLLVKEYAVFDWHGIHVYIREKEVVLIPWSIFIGYVIIPSGPARSDFKKIMFYRTPDAMVDGELASLWNKSMPEPVAKKYRLDEIMGALNLDNLSLKMVMKNNILVLTVYDSWIEQVVVFWRQTVNGSTFSGTQGNDFHAPN